MQNKNKKLSAKTNIREKKREKMKRKETGCHSEKDKQGRQKQERRRGGNMHRRAEQKEKKDKTNEQMLGLKTKGKREVQV